MGKCAPFIVGIPRRTSCLLGMSSEQTALSSNPRRARIIAHSVVPPLPRKTRCAYHFSRSLREDERFPHPALRATVSLRLGHGATLQPTGLSFTTAPPLRYPQGERLISRYIIAVISASYSSAVFTLPTAEKDICAKSRICLARRFICSAVTALYAAIISSPVRILPSASSFLP